MKTPFLSLTLAAGMLIGSAAYAAQYVYPANGQDSARQDSDEADCSAWATKQTGFDPSRAQTTASPLAGATKGLGSPTTAALGALGGGGGMGGMGGAAGIVGGMGGQSSTAMQAAGVLMGHNQQQPQQASGQANYDQARAACLQGRGYSVK